MKQLTKSEEQIMHILWDNGPLFLRDIVEKTSEPHPHQNTIATILKILIEKGFAAATIFGRQNQYAALISKQAYSQKTIKQMVKGYFNGSFSNVVSFMVKENNLSIGELEALLQQIKQQQNQ